jgi:hypothetical protein
VRNVYKVLLTRGMVGTVITSVDPETQELLERLLRRMSAPPCDLRRPVRQSAPQPWPSPSRSSLRL